MRAWLRQIRIDEKASQEWVAKKTGISRVSYTNIENGRRRPSPEKAKALAMALNFEKYGIDWTRFYEDSPEAAQKGA